MDSNDEIQATRDDPSPDDLLSPLFWWIIFGGVSWTASTAAEILGWPVPNTHNKSAIPFRLLSILLLVAAVLMFLSLMIHAGILNKKFQREFEDEDLRKDFNRRIGFIFYVMAGLQAALIGTRILSQNGLARFALCLLATCAAAWILRRPNRNVEN